MNFEELKKWIQNEMPMSQNYQPISIRTLLQNDNNATGDEIRKEISAVNSPFLPWTKTQYPFKSLLGGRPKDNI